jgi:competence protein ComEC
MTAGARALALAVLTMTAGCDRKHGTLTSRGNVGGKVPRVVISEIMANPRAVSDEHGEWVELHNLESTSVDLRGWTLASQYDRGITIDRGVVVAPGGFAVLARDGAVSTNGGVAASFAFTEGLILGNGADWLALRTPDGSTADSVAWTSAIAGASRALRDETAAHADVAGPAWLTSSTRYGNGDMGTPGRPIDGAVAAATPTPIPSPSTPSSGAISATPRGATSGTPDSTLTVRVLDVGQGDAILVENGGSRVIIDGGPEPSRFGRLLDQFGIDGSTVDAVILSHEHFDHYAGLRELFRTRRRITVRYVFENRNPNASALLAQLRDSIIARANRRELVYRDTDDPCGTGAAECTITMAGGARLYILRPDPRGSGPNNRSTAVKLVAADSSRFSMWLAGDAEQQEIAWFDATNYDRTPGMRATVLKGDHHGSCDGVSPRYLDLVRPNIVALSLAGTNDYGYVHSQTLNLLQARRIPWYRTDQNGTITITVPRGTARYTVTPERGTQNMRGPSDRPARNCGEDDSRRR